MKLHALPIQGAYLIELEPKPDERGWFARVYDNNSFAMLGLRTHWVQMNESWSEKAGTLRGLHFQRPPCSETKLVRAVRGEAFDVIVDLREEGYGNWHSVGLRSPLVAVYIPEGCAHGVCTLTDDLLLEYMVDSPYAPQVQGGVRWNDPDLAIKWPTDSPILSERDAALPTLKELGHPFAESGL